jgi:hypothetical protein
MQIHLHTLCWNDIAMLDFFFRHYTPWVDRFFIADDGSDDGTRAYLQEHPKVTLVDLDRPDPDSFVVSAKEYYDTDWRKSRGVADWVVVTNIDEHLYHPDMRSYLRQCRSAGVTAIPALGYQMVSQTFPDPESILTREIRRGVPWLKMSKLGIFKPDAIEKIAYSPGRHRVNATGQIRFAERDEVLNLHYKFLGLDYVRSRHQSQAPRLLPTDQKQGFGHKYFWDLERLKEEMADLEARAVDVMDVTLDHHKAHTEPRWWRELPNGDVTDD